MQHKNQFALQSTVSLYKQSFEVQNIEKESQITTEKSQFKQQIGIVEDIKNRLSNVMGLVLMILSILLMVANMLAFKEIRRQNINFSYIELLMVRGLFQTIIQAAQIKILKVSLQISKQQFKLCIGRALLSLISMQMLWYSFQYLNMGIFSSLQNLKPLFTLLLGYVILRESLRLPEILSILISFTGALMIVISHNQQANASTAYEVDQQQFWIAVICNIGASTIGALAMVVIRSLKNVHYTIVNGFYGVALLVISSLIWLIFRFPNEIEYNFDTYQVCLMSMIGILTTASNQLKIVALSKDKAGRIASLQFLEVFFSYCCDYFLYSIQIQMLEMLGAVLIVACSIAMLIFKIKLQ
ncbi:membrane protein [Stylonychia lemnae]|uniref:Membrane protein n=1 Tax=Stylonychia lemnae TaxID=5949 RepID=A0A078B2H4_STYLE|nr:membrane protein [Stylonychia lemnae]|eukprot:CDW88745.1 membrane protein [Stylonychia lemnae]